MCCCVSFWVAVALVSYFASAAIAAAVADRRLDEVIRAHGGEVAHRCVQLGEPHCRVDQGAVISAVDGECPPGYTRDNADACRRRYYYPRVLDSSMCDTSVSVCDDPWTYACGAWNQWFDAHDAVPAGESHQNIAPTLDASLNDRESLLHRFVAEWCRPLLSNVVLPKHNTPDAWLRVQQGAPLPLWVSDMDTHTLCVLGAVNRLLPDWFYEESIGLGAVKSASLRRRMISLSDKRGECASATLSVGALGDTATAQIEWSPPSAGDHGAFFAEMGASYGHAWSAAVALAPYTWFSIGAGQRMIARVALPRSRDEWMRRSHCERIAAVMFLEVLEDRYAAAMWRQNVRPVLSALESCTAVKPAVRVAMIERPASVRANVMRCIAESEAADWHALASVVAACNAGHRMRSDQVLIDAFVPHMEARRTADIATVRVTPAVLQPPLFSPEIEMPSIAARMYSTVLRAAAPVDDVADECVAEQQRAEWALHVLQQCNPDLMDKIFWLEMVQLQCGSVCGVHWSTTLIQNEDFRRWHDCR